VQNELQEHCVFMLAQEKSQAEYYVHHNIDRLDLEKKYINDYIGMTELLIVFAGIWITGAWSSFSLVSSTQPDCAINWKMLFCFVQVN